MRGGKYGAVESASSSLASAAPPVIMVHLALLYAHASFGSGAAVTKLTTDSGNPLVMELVRELLAAPVMLALAPCVGAVLLPDPRDIGAILAIGFCLFANTLCFILGVKLADPITGAAWQSTVPIFTVGLSVAVGYEKLGFRKGLGIFITATATVILAYAGDSSQLAHHLLKETLLGHMNFAISSLMTAVYIIISKPLLSKYRVVSLATWGLLVSICLMLATTLTSMANTNILSFLCSDATTRVKYECMHDPWRISTDMVLPLGFLVHNTLLAWYLLAWSNRHALPTTVSVFTVLQPVSAMIVSEALIEWNGLPWGLAHGFTLANCHQVIALGFIFVGVLTTVRTPSDAAESTFEAEDGLAEFASLHAEVKNQLSSKSFGDSSTKASSRKSCLEGQVTSDM
mmetsp:Transcript_50359/g.109357  ORF Transcript_50359/g.109357 Transcript_50359/m.109357 type:complete len:401 (+) Transcript_50359:80-1282(+)